MDAVHLHLAVNHVPIIGSLFGLITLAVGMILRNGTIERTGLVALAIAGISCLPAYFSGEEAEHAVEEIVHASHDELEEHEEHATLTLTLMLLAAAMSIAVLLSYRFFPSIKNAVLIATLLVGISAFVSSIPLALHGGKIIHTELR